MAKVHYNQHENLINPDDYRGVAFSAVYEALKGRGVDAFDGQRGIEEAITPFLTTAPFLKHRGFDEEREIRVVAAAWRNSRVAKKECKPIKFRDRNGLIVPYIELFKDTGTLPLSSIIVGPGPNQDRNIEAIRLLAGDRYPKAEIRKSQIPLV